MKDDGNVDLSNVYGNKNGKIGYVVPTYQDLVVENPEPIKIIEDQDFTSTSQEWLNVANPLFVEQPDCIGLTLFDEAGKFVVESRSKTGGILETYWVKPAYAGAAANV